MASGIHILSSLSTGEATKKYIGVGECLLLSSINGIIFALFAAQPLLIVGATGPLMVFDMSLYSVSTIHLTMIIPSLQRQIFGIADIIKKD